MMLTTRNCSITVFSLQRMTPIISGMIIKVEFIHCWSPSQPFDSGGVRERWREGEKQDPVGRANVCVNGSLNLGNCQATAIERYGSTFKTNNQNIPINS